MQARRRAHGARWEPYARCDGGDAYGDHVRPIVVGSFVAAGTILTRDVIRLGDAGCVVAKAGAWDGLASAVACVPVARDWASHATARHRSGTAMLWTGTLGAIVSVVGGVALVVSDPDSDTRVIGGLGLAVGGLIGGVVLAATGGYRRASAEARGIDAINLYNDQLALGPGCTSAPASAVRVIR